MIHRPATIFSLDPLVVTYEKIVTPEECQELIQLAQPQLHPSTIVGEKGLIQSDYRICNTGWIPHHTNSFTTEICERIASITRQPLHHAEPLQVGEYTAGGRFGAHFDAFELDKEASYQFMAVGGQRTYTALLYLNTLPAGVGGETFFPKLDLEIVPQEGTLLVFQNCIKGTIDLHPLSLHGSDILKEGIKYIATLWFRERPLV
ncbi:2OG-Fe(II) oxygenase [Thermoactinomyces sp. DSM 45892]|uniref:prolyl hydroxylase family protein n=1 Tax=Thermoactinomyces sp. DSM 45892 TaxID=1882753 RepID=UPI00089887F2|nr:2OG-Fe(II) oxygenase [Thermoactinomyces sp. DSM 45892]SDY39006.1 prolyl 4-hydroxylase [Thermoactinomyces sp. DSM 45892]